MTSFVDPTAEIDEITVFLVDDHPVVREGVRSALEAAGGIRVVGEAGTCADALHRVRAVGPRVVVLDVQLPDGSGAELCRQIRTTRPDIACLVLTSFSTDDALFESIMAGAAGFVLKQIGLDELTAAVRRVAAGESLVDAALIGRVLERIRNPKPDIDPRLQSLTPLERSVLKLLVQGLTNREIALHVSMSEKTVKNYVSSILHKLGMARRTEAAVFAFSVGLVDV